MLYALNGEKIRGAVGYSAPRGPVSQSKLDSSLSLLTKTQDPTALSIAGSTTYTIPNNEKQS